MSLYVCGGPIGNLGDVSFRLLEVLKAADVVLAEDTRRTLKLLAHYGLKKPLISLNQHNEADRIPHVLRGLGSGKTFALLSDAGTPGISDPGPGLVRAARKEGFPVWVIPGPSAVTAALSGAGFPADRFVFAGYPPRRSGERRRFYQEWIKPGWPSVFFEAPHRLLKSLSDLAAVWPEIDVVLYHEISKVHESAIVGTIEDVLQRLDGSNVRGEYVVVVYSSPKPECIDRRAT
ncbi:MAG TPA: 16S rRNA (cytidine(1402)-2'-O)-methyltransferase [Firmicutes bacterium]|nr:16S rRNA (cytidine(1402)-2'-O)-methyltransferase [Candidatus Fermentithermobacillaceae bacterium]